MSLQQSTTRPEESQNTSFPISLLKVSIIICCYSIERIKDICQAVQSALNQSYQSCEVIVAVDHNLELFEKLKVELPDIVRLVINTEASGLSGTRNYGISCSTGDIIAFMDDDAVAGEGWLDQLVKDYHDPLVVAVGGKTLPLWGSSRPCWFPPELDWIVGGTHKGMPATTEQVRNVWGGNMSFRKEVFQQVGLFRTDLGRIGTSGEGEDTEFCMRIRNNVPEAKIIYEPNAIMYHKVPQQRSSLKYVIRRSFDGGFSLGKIRRSQSIGTQTSLSTERNYLRYLLTISLKERIGCIYKPQVIAQIGTLFLVVLARGTGYLIGSVRSTKQSKP